MSNRTRFENGFSPKPRMSMVCSIGVQRTFTPATRRSRSGTVRAPDSWICLAVTTVTALGAREIGISVLVAASTLSCSSPKSVTSPMLFGGEVCATSVTGIATMTSAAMARKLIPTSPQMNECAECIRGRGRCSAGRRGAFCAHLSVPPLPTSPPESHHSKSTTVRSSGAWHSGRTPAICARRRCGR